MYTRSFYTTRDAGMLDQLLSVTFVIGAGDVGCGECLHLIMQKFNQNFHPTEPIHVNPSRCVDADALNYISFWIMVNANKDGLRCSRPSYSGNHQFDHIDAQNVGLCWL